MSKVRVQDITRELKEKHRLRFSHSQVLSELLQLGFQVKDHSSQLDGQQARGAIAQIVDRWSAKKDPQPAGAPEQGRIARYDAEKDFGFIEAAAGHSVFFHKDKLAAGFGVPVVGQPVVFESIRTPKGLRALYVRAAPTPVAPARPPRAPPQPLTRDTFLRALALSFPGSKAGGSGGSLNQVRTFLSMREEVDDAVLGLEKQVESPRAARLGERLGRVWRDAFSEQAALAQDKGGRYVEEALQLLVEDVFNSRNRYASPPVVRAIASELYRLARSVWQATTPPTSSPVRPEAPARIPQLPPLDEVSARVPPGGASGQPSHGSGNSSRAPIPVEPRATPAEVSPPIGTPPAPMKPAAVEPTGTKTVTPSQAERDTLGTPSPAQPMQAAAVPLPVANERTSLTTTEIGKHKATDETLVTSLTRSLAERVGSLEQRVAGLAAELTRAAADYGAAPLDLKRAQAVSVAFDAFVKATSTLVSPLPSPESVSAIKTIGDLGLADTESPLPPFVDALLSSRASELTSCVQLLAELKATPLPEWFWTSEAASTSPWQTRALSLLSDPRKRSGLAEVAEWLSKLGTEDRALLPLLAKPAGGSAEASALKNALDAARREQATLSATGDSELEGVPVRHRDWVRAALAAGDEKSAVHWLVTRLEKLRESMHQAFPAAFDHILGGSNAEERDSRLREVQAIWDEAVQAFGPSGLTAAQLQHALSSSKRRTKSTAEPGVTVDAFAELFGHPARRATLFFLANPDPSQPWGTMELPLVLRAKRAMDLRLRIRVQETSGLQRDWPSNWPRQEPLLLAIRADSWRKLEDSDEVEFPLVASIYLRKPSAGRLSVKVLIDDEATGAPLGQRQVDWERVLLEPPKLSLKWDGSTNPEFVSRHPVGPQTEFDTIRSRVEQGSSFAVFAPRRFGKTTLTRRIEQLSVELKDVCVIRTVPCTAFAPEGHFQHEQFWQAVSDNIQDALDVALPRVRDDEGVPGIGAFDAARRSAARKNKNNIVILVDEAQLFFPNTKRGHALGDLLKDRLEREWGNYRPELARVTFGFIGLRNLGSRAGTNLMGYLRPIEHARLSETEVNRLLLEVSSGALETTVHARHRIIEVSANLMVLRDVVERLVRLAESQRRSWIVDSDVQRVAKEILAHVRSDPESPIGLIVRDLFNDGDSVNDFIPNSSYAVALALAASEFGTRTRSLPEAKREALSRLREWCAQLSDPGDRHVAEVDEQRLELEFGTLKDRGAIVGARFGFPLLQSWLEGRLGRIESDDALRRALLAVSVRSIRRPGGPMERIGGGGQAELYKFQNGDSEPLVWRQFRLTEEEARGRFASTAELLKALIREQRASPCRFVFALEDIGFVEREPDVAVQVYRWIPGRDLSEHAGKLRPEAVIEVGLKLIEGLSWLHKKDILHRDIRPRNIVLRDETLEPVLIDFGLAKRLASTGDTRLEGEHVAPEVLKSKPEWGHSADVFSLCSSLKSVLGGGPHSASVARVLDRGLAQSSTDRPSLPELKKDLEHLAHDFHIDAAKDRAWKAVNAALAPDLSNARYCRVVEKLRPQIEGQAIGLRSDTLHRCALAADFLNQILEAFGQQQSLGAAKYGKVSGVDGLAVDWLHALRNWKVHGEKDLRVSIKQLAPAKLRAETQRIANSLGTAHNIRSVGPIVALVLSDNNA